MKGVQGVLICHLCTDTLLATSLTEPYSHAELELVKMGSISSLCYFCKHLEKILVSHQVVSYLAMY